MFKSYFEEEIARYEIEKFEVNNEETLYLLNDSLCLLFLKQKYSDIYDGSVARPRNKEEMYAGVSIVELSPNELGKIYNHKEYISNVEKKTKLKDLEYIITYEIFRGIRFIEEIIFDEPKKVFDYDKISPRLCLRERFDIWPGIRSDRLFCEFEDKSGKIIEFVVGSDPRRPLERLNKFCRAIANSGEIKRELLSYINSIEKFEDALLSWDDFDFEIGWND